MPNRQDPLKRLRGKPEEPIDFIPLAEDPKKVERRQAREEWKANWDKANPVSAFYIPDYLHEKAKDVHAQILRVANDKLASTGSVSYALVSYALVMVREGKLTVEANIDARRSKMTVTWEAVSPGWEKKQPIPKKVTAKLKPNPLRLAYRWQQRDVERQIKAIAKNLDTTPGEVLVFLLDYGVSAYENGAVTLNTTPVEMRQQASATWRE
jgi:hypothetical protein